MEIGSIEQAIRDSNEEESCFCNSLNAVHGWCKHTAAYAKGIGSNVCIVDAEYLDYIGDYLERAQTCITYLKSQLDKKM